MASRSMHFLRKYAKPVLVVMGVVCMITFVVGPFLLDMVSGSRASQEGKSPVAVTWTKGPVRENELELLRAQHRVVVGFLTYVISEATERGGTPMVNGRPVFKGQQIFDVGIPMDSSDEAIVHTMLMAEEARRMGIAVDQDAVKEHLKQISSPELREGDWLEIAQTVTRETPVTVGQLFEHLAYELRAQHARALAFSGLEGIPPGQLWDYFNRLNRRVTIDAYPIEVAALTPQVKGEPTAAEMERLFEKGRFRDPDPSLAEPGFHRPHKVAFGYLRVDFATYLDAAKMQITDEQIEQQYQKDIEQGLHKDLSLPESTPPADAKKEGDKSAEEKKESDQPSAEKKESEQAKADENKPAERPPAEQPPADKPQQPQDDCQAGEQPAAAKAKVEEPAAQPASVQPPQSTVPNQPVAEPPPPLKPDETKPGDAKPAEAKAGETKPAPETKFKPLSEVRESIRTQLARPIAQDAQNKDIKEVIAAIDGYGRRYRRWQTIKDFAKGKAEDPGKLDLEAIAAKHGFKAATTPLVDRFEVTEHEVGKNVMMIDIAAFQRREGNLMRSFADMAYGEDEVLYAAQEADSMVPDVKYIYYRTAEEKAADVKLADAKKQVVEAWKKQKAYELALTDAQKLADKAKGAVALKDVVADPSKIITPPPFSWMTTGSLAAGFGQPEPSRVEGIELAGPEFMHAIFALSTGQTGVAPNHAHSRVYVVRVTSQAPDEELLRQQFLETGLTREVMLVARQELFETTITDWRREIEDRYQVKWQRPPRDMSRRAM